MGVIGFDNIPEIGLLLAILLRPSSRINYNVARVAVEEIIKIIEAGWQGLEPVQAEVHNVDAYVGRQAEFIAPEKVGRKEVNAHRKHDRE